MNYSKFTNLMFTIIAGMGNVKRGYWPGILLYFSVMILLGAAIVYVEQTYIEPIYQLPIPKDRSRLRSTNHTDATRAIATDPKPTTTR